MNTGFAVSVSLTVFFTLLLVYFTWGIFNRRKLTAKVRDALRRVSGGLQFWPPENQEYPSIHITCDPRSWKWIKKLSTCTYVLETSGNHILDGNIVAITADDIRAAIATYADRSAYLLPADKGVTLVIPHNYAKATARREEIEVLEIWLNETTKLGEIPVS